MHSHSKIFESHCEDTENLYFKILSVLTSYHYNNVKTSWHALPFSLIRKALYVESDLQLRFVLKGVVFVVGAEHIEEHTRVWAVCRIRRVSRVSVFRGNILKGLWATAWRAYINPCVSFTQLVRWMKYQQPYLHSSIMLAAVVVAHTAGLYEKHITSKDFRNYICHGSFPFLLEVTLCDIASDFSKATACLSLCSLTLAHIVVGKRFISYKTCSKSSGRTCCKTACDLLLCKSKKHTVSW